jgi:hypothetical protein
MPLCIGCFGWHQIAINYSMLPHIVFITSHDSAYAVYAYNILGRLGSICTIHQAIIMQLNIIARELYTVFHTVSTEFAVTHPLGDPLAGLRWAEGHLDFFLVQLDHWRFLLRGSFHNKINKIARGLGRALMESFLCNECRVGSTDKASRVKIPIHTSS